MSVDSRKSRVKSFIPKPPETPRDPVNFNAKKFFEKKSDNLEPALNSTSSRPTSSNLSKYPTLPKIGTKPEPKYSIRFRLPDGSKVDGKFNKSDKVSTLLEYAFKYYSEVEPNIFLSQFTLFQMPYLVFDELDRKIDSYNIDKSMIFLISKNQLE